MQLVNFLLDDELATGTRQIERQAHGRQGNNVAGHRAFEKLRNHPLLRQLWRKHLAGELDEQQPILILYACGSLLDYRMNATCVDLATMKRTKTSLGKVVDAILQEGLYGKRGRLVITQPSKGQKTFPALLSQNAEPGQKPYRLSWWFPKGSPEDHGHVSLTKREADEILHGHLPGRVWLYLVRGFDVQDVVFLPLQEGVLKEKKNVVLHVLGADRHRQVHSAWSVKPK